MTVISSKHNLNYGYQSKCQVCGNKDLNNIINLGLQPPCDSLINLKEKDYFNESYFPLNFVWCKKCTLGQIDYAVDPSLLFYPEYPYRSGITSTLANNLISTAESIFKNYNYDLKKYALDIGSNDGTLLKGFKKKGMKVIGVEPTNISKIANKNSIFTINSFFTYKLTKKILKKYGKASIITGANVFAHIANLGDLLKGVKQLLNEDGIFVTESHYLLDIIKTTQYDSIYHEHLKYYSLKSIMILLKDYKLKVFHVERIPNYGGSIRIYAANINNKKAKVNNSISKLLNLEKRLGLYKLNTYKLFGQKIKKNRKDLNKLLTNILGKNKSLCGVGAPGRASTLLNYCGISKFILPYIIEQSSCLKLNMLIPGSHIPIIDEKEIIKKQPDYLLFLSWHYWKPILKNIRSKGIKSNIILPLPKVKIINY